MTHQETVFQPYIAKARTFKRIVFDFLIADEVGKQWYDASSDQFMYERQWCAEHVRPGYCVLDCGAHHGMMTILFSHFCTTTGHVIAVEALPANAKVIRQNVELNSLKNIEVHPVALWNEPGFLQFHMQSGNVRCVDRVNARTNVLSANTIDAIAAGRRIDFLKLDVEGSDLQALEGAKATLLQRPIVVIEFHCFTFKDRRDTVSAMLNLLDPRYTYEFQGEVTERVTPTPNDDNLVDLISSFENPHLYGIPASVA